MDHHHHEVLSGQALGMSSSHFGVCRVLWIDPRPAGDGIWCDEVAFAPREGMRAEGFSAGGAWPSPKGTWWPPAKAVCGQGGWRQPPGAGAVRRSRARSERREAGGGGEVWQSSTRQRGQRQGQPQGPAEGSRRGWLCPSWAPGEGRVQEAARGLAPAPAPLQGQRAKRASPGWA